MTVKEARYVRVGDPIKAGIDLRNPETMEVVVPRMTIGKVGSIDRRPSDPMIYFSCLWELRQGTHQADIPARDAYRHQ